MKANFKWCLCLIVCLLFVKTYAQTSIQHQNILWYSYQNSLELGKNWFINLEAQERHFIKPFGQNTVMFGTHVHKLIANKKVDLSAGAVFFDQVSADPTLEQHLLSLEIRPHIEFMISQQTGKIKWDHRLRTEARFFHRENQPQEDADFTYLTSRLRYRLQMSFKLFDLSENKSVRLRLGEELYINVGRKANLPFFSQSRSFLSLIFPLSKNTTIEPGFMFFYIKRDVNRVLERNIISLTLNQKFKI
ncbi:MAG: DUF2490 domain-containing protein [Saprospiraceae bacterium]|nr:DUF2490 domain-containing protein [Saprospiraceae bacterium]